MKAKYKIIAISMLLFLSISLRAQTKEEIKMIKEKTNVSKLQTLSLKYEEEYKKNKEKALRYAKLKGWEIRKKLKDGGYAELQGITDDLEPIYYTTGNNGAGITSRANTLYNGGALGLNVHGESMTAGVWDGDPVRLTHELYESRAMIGDGVTALDEFSFHGTHVTGTIIGSDQFENGDARGMAFQGNAITHVWDNDTAEMATAAAAGLLLSNHSYYYSPTGTLVSRFGKYDTQARDWDEIMFNAPLYQIVKIAGNARNLDITQVTTKNGYDLLAGAGTSKNVFVVAAVEEVQNYSWAGSVVMSPFSSWGPTDDGRIKPDISAKGVDTFSSSFDIDNPSNNFYKELDGTSMAAPSVTGTLLLLQQHYNNVMGNFMRSATLRGVTIHTADKAGSSLGPDYEFGWGLINAERAAQAISNNGVSSIIEENTLTNTGSYTKHVTANGNEPLVVTISWTDPEGIANTNTTVDDVTSVLVNDLDVRVTGFSTHLPWRLNGITNPTGAATQGDNSVDNIEKIEIGFPLTNQNFIINISHKGSLQNGNQDYSLIVTGGIQSCWTDLTLGILSTLNFGDIDHRQAENTIRLVNFGAVNSGAEAIYHAGEEISIESGYNILNGSTFRAYIEGCTGNFERKPITPPQREVITYNIPKETENIVLNTEEVSLSGTEFQITPNPTKGIFNIEAKGQSPSSFNVQIFSVAGRLMYSKEFTDQNENSFQIDISQFTSGVYIIKLVNLEGNETFTGKIIKE